MDRSQSPIWPNPVPRKVSAAQAAQRVGIAPLLAAATTSTGGVQGKAAAMQRSL
jgi:hypothetical protein